MCIANPFLFAAHGDGPGCAEGTTQHLPTWVDHKGLENRSNSHWGGKESVVTHCKKYDIVSCVVHDDDDIFECH